MPFTWLFFNFVILCFVAKLIMFLFAHLGGLVNGCKAVHPQKNLRANYWLQAGTKDLNQPMVGGVKRWCINNVPGAAVYSPLTPVMMCPKSWNKSTLSIVNMLQLLSIWVVMPQLPFWFATSHMYISALYICIISISEKSLFFFSHTHTHYSHF